MLNTELNLIIFRNKYISRVNIGLSCFGLFLILYFMFMLIAVKESGGNASFNQKAIPAISPSEAVKKSEKYYERILTRRKLFTAQTGISAGQKKNAPQNTEQADSGLSDLLLLGVVSGAQGPQAIISNVSNDRSFYCYGGENIEGFIVEQVKSDRVILKKNDETFELRL
jgi:type II secretory pathway component PulC